MKFVFTLLSLACATTCLLQAQPFESIKTEPKKAIALLKPTKGNRAQGVVSFTCTPEGTFIVADIDGLEPGKHGFHIHEYGDCSAPDGSSTGGHFNPFGVKHGGPDSAFRHVGDLGNVVADTTGHAHFERYDQYVKLDGPHTIIGRSVAVHANADDYISQPSGNAGGRVACGIIE